MVALGKMRGAIRGSYSIVATLILDGQPTLLVVRDPHGIRPAVIGCRNDGAYLAASESVALDALGFGLRLSMMAKDAFRRLAYPLAILAA